MARVNVSGWRKSQAAGELRAQVADNVSKEIAGDDHVELSRVADNLHCQRVDIQVAGVDVRIFLPDLLENPLPEVVRERHGVGFVAHADAFESILPGMFKRVT